MRQTLPLYMQHLAVLIHLRHFIAILLYGKQQDMRQILTVPGQKYRLSCATKVTLLYINIIIISGPGSSVGIATDYGLDGPGSNCMYAVYLNKSIFDSKKNPGGDEIFRPSRPALGPTQPPVRWVPGLSRAARACC